MACTAFAQDITVTLNGNIVDFPNQQPTIVDGRTLIPLRGVFDNMGYSIDWDGDTKTVTLEKDGSRISIQIGEAALYIDGSPVTIDVPAQIINGSTMIPMRAVADATGAKVLWDGDTKIATIVDADLIDTTPQGGYITTDSQQEANYADAYTKAMDEYNEVVYDFMDFVKSVSNKGTPTVSDMQTLYTKAKSLNATTNTTKNKVAALSCPSRFSTIHNATIEYMDSIANFTSLVIDFMDGNISTTEFAEKYNKLGTELSLKEAEYQNTFDQIFNQ
jgi:hypothetical protein